MGTERTVDPFHMQLVLEATGPGGVEGSNVVCIYAYIYNINMSQHELN